MFFLHKIKLASQTRQEAIGFDSWKREKEKAFARLMLPLHVPGYEKTYWSATVVESLQHEAGVCEQIENEDSLRIALWAKTSRPPPAIIPFCVIPGWRQGAKNGKLPPAALVEVYQDLEAEVAKLRRLYLIIVDLQHPIRSVESTNHDKESCVLIHSISPKFNRGWTGSKEAFQKIGKNLHPCCPLLGSVPQ